MYDGTHARWFLYDNARTLERRLAEVVLDDEPASAAAVVAALAAYQNPDGGFGHGLEPDVRASGSQPLGADFAFGVLDEDSLLSDAAAVTTEIHRLATAALDYLASVAAEAGTAGVPIVLPTIRHAGAAAHWGDGVFPPALNPTAGLVARARRFGVDHPWLTDAAAFCWQAIDTPDAVADAHTALEVLRFLETDPDRARAEQAYQAIGTSLETMAMFQPVPDEGYGLTPLTFAPRPDSPRRGFFSDEQIDAHLRALAAAQAADGGWPIAWEPPSPAARIEWRGVVTLGAVRTLRAYGIPQS